MPRINWNLRLALLGLCAGLAIVVGLEVLRSGIDLVAPWFAGGRDAANPSRTLTQLANIDIMSKDILRRPLFNASRKPPEPKKPKIEPPVLKGRLAGLVIRPEGKEALFTRPGGALPVVVKEGGEIDGFTLASIEANRVVLRSSFGDQVFKPTNASADEGIQPKPHVIKKRAPTRPTPPPPTPTVAATAAQQVR